MKSRSSLLLKDERRVDRDAQECQNVPVKIQVKGREFSGPDGARVGSPRLITEAVAVRARQVVDVAERGGANRCHPPRPFVLSDILRMSEFSRHHF